MKRLSGMFAGVGVVLLAALALLVTRALESVRRERDLRHQAVAERIFDEMERELTELVRREESRPFEHYLYYYESASAGTLERSPLADLPAEPFIVGYYQVDPSGLVTSPLVDSGLASPAIAGWPDSLARLEAIASTREAVAAASVPPPARSVAPEALQSPGTTRNVASKDESFRDSVGATAYLKSMNELNRGALEREQRVSKLSQVATSNVSPANASDNAELELERAAVASAVDVVLESMEGRRSGSNPSHLLLARRAVSGGRHYEQGLVIDIERLVAWLDETVLAPSELASVAEVSGVSHDGAWPPSAAEGALKRYRRQFAEPFGAVASVLTLAPLPDASDVNYVYGMSALLALAVTTGLFGLYRMVAVTVTFAERQKNFVSAVTHELKTPLTAIRMYGEMLRDGLVGSEDKKKHYYEVITSESERLTRLVGNVLELSRLERKNRKLRPVSGHVRPVLDEIAHVLEPHARSEGFALRVESEDDLPVALFDRDALVQVLFNLVDNAVKYAKDPASGDILLRARRHGGGVVLSVADGGPGVSEEHLAHVFEPFYRGQSELTRTSQGTGIGLALVRGLVEEMGGRVEGANLDAGGFEVSVVLRSV